MAGSLLRVHLLSAYGNKQAEDDKFGRQFTQDFNVIQLFLGYRAAAWIGYYRLLLEIIGYFPYSFKIHELPGGKNVWK